MLTHACAHTRTSAVCCAPYTCRSIAPLPAPPWPARPGSPQPGTDRGCLPLSRLRNAPKAPPAPALRTVKMLERRLDCLRMGVGVLEAAMVSIRSSRWLMLGVEGTEEE